MENFKIVSFFGHCVECGGITVTSYSIRGDKYPLCDECKSKALQELKQFLRSDD